MRYHRFQRIPVLVALIALVSACDNGIPADIAGPPVVPPPPPPVIATATFAPVSSTATVYYRASPALETVASRFVLYENGLFEAEYAMHGGWVWRDRGSYTRSDSIIRFTFGPMHSGATWLASGVLRGDSLDVSATFSAQGEEFENGLFVRRAVSTAFIYLADARGSAITSLTAGGWPAWSRDGQQIAFHEQGHIHVIHADGSQLKRLRHGAYPTWSPDGKRIAFTNLDGIAVMDADGSNSTTLLRHSYGVDAKTVWNRGVTKPAWSPDGKHIAFERIGDADVTPAQIYIMNADGSEPRPLTSEPEARRSLESDPSWSVDGSRIVLWSFNYGIARVDPSSGVPETLYANFPVVAYGTRPSLLPDGKSLLFTMNAMSAAVAGIWVIPTSGGAPQLLFPGGYEATSSSVTARIAFVRDR